MEFKDLQEEVIKPGLCTGCGSCVGVCPTGGMDMVYIDHEPEPVLKGECNACSLCYEVCPGKDIPLPDLEEMVFGRKKKQDKEPLSIYRACLAGHAIDEKTRQSGASGGVASALLIFALEQGLIDLALAGEMSSQIPWHTKPLAASSKEEVLRSAKSKSQIVPTNALISEALKRGSKIGHVGLGCHVHALRKLQLKYPSHKFSKALSFTLGLFCFSNYYTMATELLILERTGIKSLDDVAKVEYRIGKPRGNFRVTSHGGEVFIVPGGEVHNFNRFFCRDRCQMCLDWCNELADISLGDYWGPSIDGKDMHRGWSTIIVRTEAGERLLKEAEAKGYVATYPTEAAYLRLCGGFYRKKHVNVYNIMKRRHHNYPTPDFGHPLFLEPIKREVSYDFVRSPHLSWMEEHRHQTAK